MLNLNRVRTFLATDRSEAEEYFREKGLRRNQMTPLHRVIDDLWSVTIAIAVYGLAVYALIIAGIYVWDFVSQ